MTRDMFRKTEKRLYSYPHNLSLIGELAGKIAQLRDSGDVHAQDYGGRVKAGAGDADPVGAYVQNILTLEHRISVLEQATRPVTSLLEYLEVSAESTHKHCLTILREFYFSRTPASRLLEATGWHRSTFYSRRLSLVIMAASFFGFCAETE